MKNKCLAKKETRSNRKEGLKVTMIRARPLELDDILEISLITKEVNN